MARRLPDLSRSYHGGHLGSLMDLSLARQEANMKRVFWSLMAVTLAAIGMLQVGVASASPRAGAGKFLVVDDRALCTDAGRFVVAQDRTPFFNHITVGIAPSGPTLVDEPIRPPLRFRPVSWPGFADPLGTGRRDFSTTIKLHWGRRVAPGTSLMMTVTGPFAEPFPNPVSPQPFIVSRCRLGAAENDRHHAHGERQNHDNGERNHDHGERQHQDHGQQNHDHGERQHHHGESNGEGGDHHGQGHDDH